jgi:hypothetical protein
MGRLEGAAPFLFVTIVVFSIYVVFSHRHHRLVQLAIGALVASLLWFAMRPVFNLFLIYNPGYGFTFGSFKSLFVVIIWIYFSFIAFLIGAEVAASIGRAETAFLKTLVEGDKNVPLRIIGKYVILNRKRHLRGGLGNEMYSVLSRVAIMKGATEIAYSRRKYRRNVLFTVGPGRLAVALDAVELVATSREHKQADERASRIRHRDPQDLAGRGREINTMID